MKTLFWNVDTQYDFMRDDTDFRGALPVPGARTIEPNLEKLTVIARERGMKIIFSGDWHTPESSEFSDDPDFIRTFPPHCLMETKGAEYVPATTPINPLVIDWQKHDLDLDKVLHHPGDIIVYKDTFDVFGGSPQSPHARLILDTLSPDKVFVYGVATNVCVNFAVLGLQQREREVFAIRDAMKELPGLSLMQTLNTWENRGIRTITTDEVKYYL